MDCGTCGEHTDQVAKVRSFSLVVKVFGTVISLLLVYLLSQVSSTNNSLNEYKIEHSKITSEVMVDLAIISGDVKNSSQNIAEIKRMLQSKQVFAEVPDTSTLMVFDYE